jgi:hypothetical protein
MRKFYFFLMTMLVTTAAWSQTYTWSGVPNASWTLATNWTPNRNSTTANDTLLFSAGNIVSILNVPSQTVARIRVFNGTNITLSGQAGNQTLTIGNANGAAPDLIISSGSSLTQNTTLETITLANSATADISGTLIVNGNYNTGGTSVVTTVSSSGTIDNKNTVTNTTPAKLVFNSGAIYIHNQDNGNIPDGTWNAASNCNITGVTSNAPSNTGQTFGNFTWNCAGQNAEVSTGASITDIAGNFTVTNTNNQVLRPSSGSNVTFNIGGDFVINGANAIYVVQDGDNVTNNKIYNVAGNFSLSAGTLRLTSTNSALGTSQLNVAKNFSLTGGTMTELGTGTSAVNFSGTSTQTYTSGGTIANTINFTINGGAIVDFDTSTLGGSNGTFTLSSTGKIITSNAGGIPSTILVTGTKTYSSGADYEFKGAATGVFTTSPTAATARNITINNSSSFVTLSQPMSVTGALSLQNGELHTTATNLITVVDNATANATNTSFIVGPILKKGNDDFVFPTGRTGAGLIPIKISGLSAASDFQAEHKASPATTAGATITAAGLKRVSGCEYWLLTRTGAATANVTMYWNAFSNCNSAAYVTDLSTIVAAHSNGASWDSYNNDGGTSGDAISGTVTWNNVSIFSPFALGSTSTASNPLPVLFDNVRAYEKGTGVQIEWSNLTERELINYTIERSVDGSNYSDISVVLPKSNQNDKADYVQFDATPARGANFYRIRVLQINGKLIYSKILRVETGNVKQSFGLYPNPVSGNQVTLALSGIKSGQYNVKVINSAGQQIYQKQILSQGGSISQTLQLPSAVKPGIYTMLVSSDGYMESKHFVVQ